MSFKSPIICLDVNLTGVNITTGAASAQASIPNN